MFEVGDLVKPDFEKIKNEPLAGPFMTLIRSEQKRSPDGTLTIFKITGDSAEVAASYGSYTILGPIYIKLEHLRKVEKASKK